MDPVEFNGIFQISFQQTHFITEHFWTLWSLESQARAGEAVLDFQQVLPVEFWKDPAGIWSSLSRSKQLPALKGLCFTSRCLGFFNLTSHPYSCGISSNVLEFP